MAELRDRESMRFISYTDHVAAAFNIAALQGAFLFGKAFCQGQVFSTSMTDTLLYQVFLSSFVADTGLDYH